MKKLCMVLSLAGVMAASNLFASIIGTGSLYITAPGYTGSALSTGDQAGPYQVSSLTRATGVTPISTGGSFETFCLGTQVEYTPGNNYGYQISDTVQPGGSVAGPGDVGLPGYVTWGTAYLYSQFRAGAYNVIFNLSPGSINNQETDALQAAIWTLQGQNIAGYVSFGTSDPSGPTAIEINYFLNLASTAAGVLGDGRDANGAFGVYALDMLSGGSYLQPQLVMIPVPEPTTVVAGVLLLLPFGASTLRILRNRKVA